MDRYFVTVVASEAGQPNIDMVVPFSSASSVGALAKEVERRLSRSQEHTAMTDLTLYLGHCNGPRLDDEDTLSQVVLRAEKEAIFGSSRRKRAGQQLAAPPAKRQHPSIAEGLVSSSSITDEKVADAFKLRIITPALAHAHKVRHTIAVLQDPMFVNTTLGHIKARTSAHLGASISSSSVEPPELRECNCSFARFIHARGI